MHNRHQQGKRCRQKPLFVRPWDKVAQCKRRNHTAESQFREILITFPVRTEVQRPGQDADENERERHAFGGKAPNGKPQLFPNSHVARF